jgi:inorganic phosphate transporter, PiT family
MSGSLLLVGFIILVALAFDYINGFHDAANSIATVVSTRVLTPMQAVAWAAFFNFVAAFGFGVQVARTVGKGVVDAGVVDQWVILGALSGAITWNLITWYVGLPSSSSHALIGGVIGSAIAAAGLDVVNWHGLVDKVLVPSLLAPFFGIVLAAAIMLVLLWIIRRRHPGIVNRVFRRLQIVSGGFVAFTHGTNDAQKTMGIISLALVVSGNLDADFTRPPDWVIFGAATAMALGTYAGGWRIIKTLGTRVAKLDPPQGFAAQTSCATILWLTAHYGFPVSTTHTISGSVLGAGATRRLSAVRWGVAGNILVAWVMTIPCAGLVGAVMEELTTLPGGTALVFVLTGLIAAAAFLGRSFQGRRLAVTESTA